MEKMPIKAQSDSEQLPPAWKMSRMDDLRKEQT